MTASDNYHLEIVRLLLSYKDTDTSIQNIWI